MKRNLGFPLFCLVFGLVVFGVSYTLLGQGPGSGPGDLTGNEEVGPVAVVSELFEVIEGGDVAALEDLLRSGADPNEANDYGHTALHWAIATDSPVVYGQVSALLNAGANPNLADKKGLTPL